jgi:hypothetical protein
VRFALLIERHNAMQEAISITHALPAQRARRIAGRLSLMEALHSTFGVFAHHPLALFGCALLFFSSAGLIGSLLYGGLIFDAVQRTGSHSGSVVRIVNTQMLAQAVIGSFLLVLGRGAVAWIAMQDASAKVTFGMAVRAALREWQPLLISALLYGALITAGIVGLSVLLRELRIDVSNARWLRGDLNSVMNWVTARGVALLPPDAGAPFSEWIAAAKYNLSRLSGATYFGFDVNPYGGAQTIAARTWLLGAVSIVLLFIIESLLCMRSATIMALGGTADWLRETLALSGRHFWRVAAWRWALRLMVFALFIGALVVLPALHQAVIMNAFRQQFSAGYWTYHIAMAAYGIGGAIITGIIAAFSVAFESRMYVALKQANE